MVEYKTVNGVKFATDAPDKVVKEILYYMNTDYRVRLFYGDNKTGRDWGEEYDTMGYVRKSLGGYPILIYNRRSMGGGSILTDAIVRMTVGGYEVYRHPKYKGDVTVKGNEVYLNGKIWGVAKNHEKAVKLGRFLSGKSNTKG